MSASSIGDSEQDGCYLLVKCENCKCILPPISTVYGSTEHSRRHIGQARALCAGVRKKHVPLASLGMDYNLKMVTTCVTRSGA